MKTTKHPGRPKGWRRLRIGETRREGDIALFPNEWWNTNYTTKSRSPITEITTLEYFRPV